MRLSLYVSEDKTDITQILMLVKMIQITTLFYLYDEDYSFTDKHVEQIYTYYNKSLVYLKIIQYNVVFYMNNNINNYK